MKRIREIGRGLRLLRLLRLNKTRFLSYICDKSSLSDNTKSPAPKRLEILSTTYNLTHCVMWSYNCDIFPHKSFRQDLEKYTVRKISAQNTASEPSCYLNGVWSVLSISVPGWGFFTKHHCNVVCKSEQDKKGFPTHKLHQ